MNNLSSHDDEFSDYTDEELEAIANGGGASAQSQPAQSGSERSQDAYADYTDEELARIAYGDRYVGRAAASPMRPENFAGEPAMGGIELQRLRDQAAGAPAAEPSDGSFTGWAKNLGHVFAHNTSGRVSEKNIGMNLQDILRGTVRRDGKDVPLTKLPDDELDYLVDAAGWNGAGAWFRRFLGSWARSDSGVMQDWDRTQGAKIADPAERKAARVRYAQEIARDIVAQNEWEKGAAQAEIEGREKQWQAGATAGLAQTGSYMFPFLAPGVGAVLAGAIGGAERGQEMASDRYEMDEDGNIYVAAERDSTGAAIAKGVARGIVEPAVEKVGGKLATKALGSLAGATLGRIPLVKSVGGKIAATGVGKSLAKYGKTMDRLGKATGLQGAPEEVVEEFEDNVIDAVLGIDRRESEKRGGALSRGAEAAREFFKPESLKNLAESMLLVQILGGGIAHVNDRYRSKPIDNILSESAGIDRAVLRDYTADEKWAAYEAYVEDLSEDEVKEKLSKGADAVNELTKLISESKEWKDAIVRNRAAQPQQQPPPEAQPAPAAAPELPAHENRLRRQQPNFRHRGQGEEPLPAEEPVQTEQQTTEPIQEKTNETRNVPVETQPQPSAQDAGRDGQQPPPQAEPRPVEAQPQGSEVPAAGQIEAQPERADGFQLESATPQQIAAEEARRREQAEIKRRQEAPLKGSGAVNVQPEMDLGQTGQQDLFSPIAEKPKNAPVAAPKKTGATMPPEAAKPAEGGKSVSGADKMDDAHETNVARAAEIIAEQARKNTKDESITADNVRRGAESLVTAIENRDANALRSRFNGLNKGSVKAFEAITGLKMPSTQKGQHEVVDRFCGISPEERTRIDAAREAEAKAVKEARRKEQSLRDGENAASRFKVKLEDGKVTTAKELVGERGWQVRVGKRGAVNETWIIDPKTGMGVKVKSEMREYLTSLMQKPAKTAPASAPSAEGTTTPMEAAKPAEAVAPAAAPRAPVAAPAFKRGDRVFLKGAADGQRVTFVKANADGTADVQVRTPGANRYMPEKVETRTVSIGDVSGGGMKDTLTDAERSAYRRGVAEQQRDSMRDDPILQRIDAAYRTAKTDAERNALKAQFVDRARQLQSAAGLDSSEARASRGNAQDVPAKWTDAARKPLERVAHALRNAVTVGGNRLKVSFADRPAEADGQTRKSISGVFTGTAADYANRSRQGGVDDGPSVKHIGTGEGAQAYGWGLYGSNRRGVAEGYAKSSYNQRNEPIKVDGEIVDFAKREEWSKAKKAALDELNTTRNVERAIQNLEYGREYATRRTLAEHAIKYLREHKFGGMVGEHIYEQTFFTDRAPGDESHLLKWYEPTSKQQVEWIEKQLEAEGLSDRVNMSFLRGELPSPENPSGGRENAKIKNGLIFYNHLANKLGSPKAASEFLARAGIDGVKYPVGTAGGKVKDGDKTGWNYVAFSDEHIRVDHKWTDGELRYMRNADGVIVGEYDAAKGEIRLYPGATVADVVHEFTHPLMDYARAEADAGRGEFMGKIKQIIDAERATWEKPVRDAYAGKGEGEILEEIFAHAMGVINYPKSGNGFGCWTFDKQRLWSHWNLLSIRRTEPWAVLIVKSACLVALVWNEVDVSLVWRKTREVVNHVRISIHVLEHVDSIHRIHEHVMEIVVDLQFAILNEYLSRPTLFIKQRELGCIDVVRPDFGAAQPSRIQRSSHSELLGCEEPRPVPETPQNPVHPRLGCHHVLVPRDVCVVSVKVGSAVILNVVVIVVVVVPRVRRCWLTFLDSKCHCVSPVMLVFTLYLQN